MKKARRSAGATVSAQSGASSNTGFSPTRPAPPGFTLTELLMVMAGFILLAGLLFSAARHVIEERDIAQCASRLRQVGAALNMYRDGYRRFPEARPPGGFGDLSNWGDAYASTDTPDNAYFSSVPGADGIPLGDKTRFPRVPRCLVEYLFDVTIMACPCNGPSSYWPETGPYYYDATSPWGNETMPDGQAVTNYGSWVARCGLRRGEAYALAACQAPTRSGMLFGGWRHGERAPADPDGVNNHLLVGGSVHRMRNPAAWNTPPGIPGK